MRVSYAEGYVVPLPERHPFPMTKFALLHDLLLREGLIQPSEVVPPRQADWSDLLYVHTPDYLSRLAEGKLDRQEVRKMGFPWSKKLVVRSRLAVQGTINAALMALEDGVAGNLAGGTHHAFPGHGEGFCVLNDVAVAIRVLERARWIRRALVIDLDVHQGNGTAAIFNGDDVAYTLSIHGAKNYPYRKPPSTVDIGLPDATTDSAYLATLTERLPGIIADAMPDIVFYLAGIDVVKGDRFGRLALSEEGLYARDRCVVQAVRDAHLPLTMLLSGGYAHSPAETARLHAMSHRAVAEVYG